MRNPESDNGCALDVRSRVLVGEHGAQRCTSDVNQRHRRLLWEDLGAYSKKQGTYIRGGECDDSLIHGTDNIATIELERQPTLGAWPTKFDTKLAGGPQASEAFKRKVVPGTMLIALE